jgi:hypothetical protein
VQSSLTEYVSSVTAVREPVRELWKLCLSSDTAVTSAAAVATAYGDDAVVPVAQLQCEFAALTKLLQRIAAADVSAATKSYWAVQLLTHRSVLTDTSATSDSTAATAATAQAVHALQCTLMHAITRSAVRPLVKEVLFRRVLAPTSTKLAAATAATAATSRRESIAAIVRALEAELQLRDQLKCVLAAAPVAVPAAVREPLTVRLLNPAAIASTSADIDVTTQQQQQQQQASTAAVLKDSAALLALHDLQQHALTHINSCAGHVRTQVLHMWKLCVLANSNSVLSEMEQSIAAAAGAAVKLEADVAARERSKLQALKQLIMGSKASKAEKNKLNARYTQVLHKR